jgi:pimeloyl-ACP methyl ester carboxylesterase
VRKQSRAADLLGTSRLLVDAVTGVSELVEAVHMNVLNKAIGTPAVKPVAFVTRMVYRTVRGVTGLVGMSLEQVLSRLVPVLGEQANWAGRDALLSAVNGVLGDRLHEQGNPLAIRMALRRHGVPLVAGEGSGTRLLVLVHGLCMNDLQWEREGVDLGATLARERGYSSAYLHYNTGRHISTNGREFAEQLEQLVAQWPVPLEEIVIVGHSMGGLVARSACQAGEEAGHRWPGLLSKLVTLGTPHHGAPLERGGNWVHLITDLTPYSAPFSRLAKIRSAGITDLRHGSVQDADWHGKDRFAQGSIPAALPLPARVQCYAVAATLGESPKVGEWVGDGLVPLASALGQHRDPQRRLHFDADKQVIVAHTNHMDLLNSAAVQAHLLRWL